MRIAVFVDGSNFFYMQRDCLNWWVDPRKLLDWLEDEYEDYDIADATYYTSVDTENESQKSFLKALTYMGYSVVEKAFTKHSDNNKEGYEGNNGRRQSNMCVDIITDMFNTIESYDMAVLVSGDADFLRPLQSIRDRGKKFLVMSTAGFISREVRSLVGMHFIDFNEVKEHVAKGDNHGFKEDQDYSKSGSLSSKC